MDWIPCPCPNIGDVIRWKEAIRDIPKTASHLPMKIGEQRITAELQSLGETLQLQIQEIEILSLDSKVKRSEHSPASGDIISRHKSTIENGYCQRLLTSAETTKKSEQENTAKKLVQENAERLKVDQLVNRETGHLERKWGTSLANKSKSSYLEGVLPSTRDSKLIEAELLAELKGRQQDKE